MAQLRIIKLEAQSATQNVIDNVNEDIFMPADGDYSNAFGKKKKSDQEGEEKGSSGNLFTKIFGTKEERVKRRADRKARRMARKSSRQQKQEEAAKAKALADGKTAEQANAIATAAGQSVKQAEEKQISNAGTMAAAKATSKGAKPEEVEAARDQAEEAKEAEIFSGTSEENPDKPNFWKSMSNGAKITLIGGSAVVLGLIIWGVVSSKKK